MRRSVLDYNINALVDENKIREVEEFFNSLSPEETGFHGVKFTVKKGKLIDINLSEYYKEFPDDKLFAEKLKEALIKGSIDLYFFEDDDCNYHDDIRRIEIIPGKAYFYQREFVPDNCQPLYCKKCCSFMGFIAEEEWVRLNETCAKCTREDTK